MIVLTVLSYNGAPADGPSGSFDELGGTIGRADNNQLVLPDPERTISRVHARIVYRASGYTIVDNGSNPISVNGTPLGTGREQPLHAGDQVQIGGYVLKVSEGAAAPADPFADLFGDGAPVGLAVPPAPPKTMRSVTQTWTPAPAAPSAAPSPWPAPSPAMARGAIPDDWDPFAVDEPTAPAPSAQPPGPAAGAGLGGLDGLDLPMVPPSAESLDALFDLGGAAPAADPLGAAPAEALLMQPNTAGHADPLRSLQDTATIIAPSHGDLGSELHTPMVLPPSAPRLDASPSPVPSGAVFSWDAPPRDGRVVTLPGVRRGEAMPRPPMPPIAAVAPVAPVARAMPAPNALPPAAARGFDGAPPRAAAAAPRGAGDDALLAALLDGLAVPGLRIDALTPELMRLIGTLLRESTRGAVELLVARAALKREMRAEMTMIVAKENNPLKFSPSVEVALQHLLGTPAPGFMSAAPAIRDAFDDLRAHQLGVMAGMKAALDGVLQRFDPQQLEGKLTKKSAISTLLPSGRKARLWELFQELFAQLNAEAQDDFDELFGKAFLKAYEAQLDRLHGEPGPR